LILKGWGKLGLRVLRTSNPFLRVPRLDPDQCHRRAPSWGTAARGSGKSSRTPSQPAGAALASADALSCERTGPAPWYPRAHSRISIRSPISCPTRCRELCRFNQTVESSHLTGATMD